MVMDGDQVLIHGRITIYRTCDREVSVMCLKHFFIYVAIMFLASGCRVSEEHQFFKEGEITENNLFSRFSN